MTDGFANFLFKFANIFGEVYFRSGNTGNVTVSPSQASSWSEQIEITGVSEGYAAIPAKLYDPVSFDIIATFMATYSYNQDSYTVAVRVVHEDDDDVQVVYHNLDASSFE